MLSLCLYFLCYKQITPLNDIYVMIMNLTTKIPYSEQMSKLIFFCFMFGRWTLQSTFQLCDISFFDNEPLLVAISCFNTVCEIGLQSATLYAN